MPKIDMRQHARVRLTQARTLLAKGDEDSVRHACLELRLAIEYLAYQQLQAYLDEVSDDAMRKWTPRQVIAEMLEVDPHSDETSSLAVGIEVIPGVRPPEMQFLGEDRRFSLGWANKNHNALGNFLHAPTLHQMESGQVPSAEKMSQKAIYVADTIQQILDSPLHNVNFGVFFKFDCYCGARIKRRDGSFKRDDGIRCPSCDAVYDVTGEDRASGQYTFALRQERYRCQSCGQENWVGVHVLKVGTILKCRCGARTEVVCGLVPIDDAKVAGEE